MNINKREEIMESNGTRMIVETKSESITYSNLTEMQRKFAIEIQSEDRWNDLNRIDDYKNSHKLYQMEKKWDEEIYLKELEQVMRKNVKQEEVLETFQELLQEMTEISAIENINNTALDTIKPTTPDALKDLKDLQLQKEKIDQGELLSKLRTKMDQIMNGFEDTFPKLPKLDEFEQKPMKMNLLQWCSWYGQDQLAGRVIQILKYDVNELVQDDWQQRTPLLLAAQRGHAKVLEKLIQFGADVEQPTVQLKTPLFRSASFGKEDCVRILLKYKAQINTITKDDHTTALYLAVQEGFEGCVKILLDSGADVNIPDDQKISPLARSTIAGCNRIAKLLLDYGADVNLQTELGKTPLLFACDRGNTELTKCFLEKKADPNLFSTDRHTPLYVASYDGHLECIKLLIEYGADVHLSNNNNATPVYVAAQNGNLDCVKYLHEHGGDIVKCTNRNVSPLFISCQEGNKEIAEYLIEHGVDVNQETLGGSTPLLVACETSKNDSLVRMLLDYGADYSKKMRGGINAGICAVNSKCLDTFKLLVESGMKIEECSDQQDRSCLNYAISIGCLDIVKYLIEEMDQDLSSITAPLYLAANQNHPDVIDYLIEQGENPLDLFYTDTLLSMAAYHHSYSVIAYLFKKHPKVRQLIYNVNGAKQSPLHMALANNN